MRCPLKIGWNNPAPNDQMTESPFSRSPGSPLTVPKSARQADGQVEERLRGADVGIRSREQPLGCQHIRPPLGQRRRHTNRDLGRDVLLRQRPAPSDRAGRPALPAR